jgi:hypothetical protein
MPDPQQLRRLLQSLAVQMPPGDDPDGSAHLLRPLDLDPATYARFATQYYETEVSLASVVAIYRHQPLTPELVATLNKDASLDRLRAELVEIGYP